MGRAQRRAAERRAAKAKPKTASVSPPQAAKPRAVASPPRDDRRPVDELDALIRLRRATQARAAAERELTEAMRVARDAGLSFGRIGGAVGVSGQAVRQRLLRDSAAA